MFVVCCGGVLEVWGWGCVVVCCGVVGWSRAFVCWCGLGDGWAAVAMCGGAGTVKAAPCHLLPTGGKEPPALVVPPS